MPSGEYDQNAKIFENMSDAATGPESDGDTLVYSPAENDRDVLADHEEAERLLTGPKSAHSKTSKTRRLSSRSNKKQRHGRTKKGSHARRGTSRSVYKMEEGYKDTSSNSSTESLLLQPSKVKITSSTRSSYLGWVLMATSITMLFIVLAYGAYRASLLRPNTFSAKGHNNGTHLFKATTILISLDGFRADFLQRGLTPSMNAFIASGVSPKYMLPSFPSVTFPNHYTLVTGLYPESHGIVSNQFWDPEFEEEFYYTNTSISMQPKWWEKAEPIWVAAEKQGIKTAIHMWPGSEAHIHGLDPTYLDTFNAHEKLPKKVDRILELLDMESEERPQLIAAYVPDVDRDGHRYGPNSTEIRAPIANADNMLTLLIEGLLQRNLTEIVNIVIVSDHGMATMSAHRMVQLDDLIDMSLIDHIDGWPLRGLRLKNPERDVLAMYEQLSKAAREHGTFDVYTLDTMPNRYHFSNNPRIAPLWVIPKTGWLVIERKEFDIAKAIDTGKEFQPIGVHGFDHEHPLMRAIFIARGPAFPHAPNSRVSVFQNIEVYNIICDSLGIVPHVNNGTIRLPLQPEGLHSDFSDPVELPPDDPADIHVAPTNTAPSIAPAASGRPSPDEQSFTKAGKHHDDTETNWWKYLHQQLEKAKEWAKEVIESVKDNVNGSSATGAG